MSTPNDKFFYVDKPRVKLYALGMNSLRYASPMSEKRNPGGRPPGIRYPKRLMVYETERGVELLQQIAARWETTQADAMRRLVRDKARELGLINGKDSAEE